MSLKLGFSVESEELKRRLRLFIERVGAERVGLLGFRTATLDELITTLLEFDQKK